MNKKEKEWALLIVDMILDFCHPGGALYVRDGNIVSRAIANHIDTTNYRIYVCTNDEHPSNHYSFKENGGTWPKHAVKGTLGATMSEFVNYALSKKLIQFQYFIVKGTDPNDKTDYSGFSGQTNMSKQNLSQILKQHNVEQVDIVGLALDYCVKATALDAIELGLKTRVLLQYTKAVDAKTGIEAIQEMKEKGVIIVK